MFIEATETQIETLNDQKNVKYVPFDITSSRTKLTGKIN